nr:hypothetical protein [Halococcus salsus]
MLLTEELDIDQETLTETAQWYELDSTVAAMYRPLHGEFEPSEESPVAIPSETEFMALKDQYGVT